MAWADELSAGLDDVDSILGESFVWNRYTYGAHNALAGTAGTATLAQTATLDCCRTATRTGLEGGSSGGRTGVERFEVTVNLARLGWTPTPADTEVVVGGNTYRVLTADAENDGKSARVRCERLVSE